MRRSNSFIHLIAGSTSFCLRFYFYFTSIDAISDKANCSPLNLSVSDRYICAVSVFCFWNIGRIHTNTNTHTSMRPYKSIVFCSHQTRFHHINKVKRKIVFQFSWCEVENIIVPIWQVFKIDHNRRRKWTRMDFWFCSSTDFCTNNLEAVRYQNGSI